MLKQEPTDSVLMLGEPDLPRDRPIKLLFKDLVLQTLLLSPFTEATFSMLLSVCREGQF